MQQAVWKLKASQRRIASHLIDPSQEEYEQLGLNVPRKNILNQQVEQLARQEHARKEREAHSSENRFCDELNFSKMVKNKSVQNIHQSNQKQLARLKDRFKNEHKGEEIEKFFHYIETDSLLDIKYMLLRNPGLARASNDRGDFPLHVAAKKAGIPVIQFLIDSGADVNAINRMVIPLSAKRRGQKML